MAYKGAVDKKQATLRRIVPKNLGDFVVMPTPGEYIENLKKKKGQLDDQLRALRESGVKKTDPGRMALAEEAKRIQAELTELRARRIFPKGFKDTLIDVIRESVTQAQWNIWSNQTQERMKTEAITIEVDTPPPSNEEAE